MIAATRPPSADRRPPEGLPELPSGWEWTKLGFVLARIEAGRSPKNQGRPARDGEFGVLKVSAVSWGEFLPEENKALLPGDSAEAELTVRAGDLLISRANTTELVGAVVYVERDHPNLMLSDKTLRLVPTSRADPKFLLYALRLPLARDFFARGATGTSDSMRNISQDKIREVPIPLPPLAEQRLIVARVEALLAQARTAREALAPVSALVRRLRQAVLAAAFSGRLSEREPGDEPAGELLERIRAERALLGGRKGREEARALPEGLPELPEGWEWARTHELAHIGTGATPLRKEKARYYDSGTIPWVTSSALNKLYVEEAEEYITELAVAETNTKVFPKGTLLVAMYGEGRTRGLVSELSFDAATNQACAGLVFEGQALVCKPFVKLFFQKNYDDIRRLSSGGVQPNLNLSIVGNTLLPLAPLVEQRRIVARVEALLAQADVIEQAVSAVSQRIADVERAVLARAFRGELVEQEAAQEPVAWADVRML